jgi:hypothetical protein
MAGRTTGTGGRLDAWLHTDLLGIPVTLAAVALVAASGALYLVLGDIGGLIVGKTLFVVALAGLLALILSLDRRRGESIDGFIAPPPGASRRVLIVGNRGLTPDAVRTELRALGPAPVPAADVIVPVIAPSPLHALADDVDGEVRDAERRLEAALAELCSAGVGARGHVDIAAPARSLADGLREFCPSEVVLMPGPENGWGRATRLAQRVHDELGLPVTTVGA